jgi:4-hydroxy-3-methylbut-2-en-1-yl diphosphate synthase IspG/GcpE
MAKRVLAYLEEHNLIWKSRSWLCVVNGPGEARDADYGMAGGNGMWVLFKRGKTIKTVVESEAFEL